MDSIPATPSRCAQCHQPPFIGTRCFRHYVIRLARYKGLMKYKWFTSHLDKFIDALRGRYSLMLLGVEPPTRDMMIRGVWSSGPRPQWVDHRGRNHGHTPKVNTRARLDHVIEVVEKRAVEDSHEADHRGQEGG
jgi:hypothetical protein